MNLMSNYKKNLMKTFVLFTFAMILGLSMTFAQQCTPSSACCKVGQKSCSSETKLSSVGQGSQTCCKKFCCSSTEETSLVSLPSLKAVEASNLLIPVVGSNLGQVSWMATNPEFAKTQANTKTQLCPKTSKCCPPSSCCKP